MPTVGAVASSSVLVLGVLSGSVGCGRPPLQPSPNPTELDGGGRDSRRRLSASQRPTFLLSLSFKPSLIHTQARTTVRAGRGSLQTKSAGGDRCGRQSAGAEAKANERHGAASARSCSRRPFSIPGPRISGKERQASAQETTEAAAVPNRPVRTLPPILAADNKICRCRPTAGHPWQRPSPWRSAPYFGCVCVCGCALCVDRPLRLSRRRIRSFSPLSLRLRPAACTAVLTGPALFFFSPRTLPALPPPSASRSTPTPPAQCPTWGTSRGRTSAGARARASPPARAPTCAARASPAAPASPQSPRWAPCRGRRRGRLAYAQAAAC